MNLIKLAERVEGLCSHFEDHTPCPESYHAWHDWASRMAKTHRQLKCHGCDRYKIWVPKVPAAALRAKAGEGL